MSRARAAEGILPPPYIIPYRDSVSADNSNRLVPRPTTRNDAFNARRNFSPLIGRARARGERISLPHQLLRKPESLRMRFAEHPTAGPRTH